ncbi:MAG TPA: glycogen debranching N-terminal domain-containing protein, partial [Candidatus Binatia bacterium]|nr:glycogen debranching N-terminal domain-containing protein [Candidatus Binatia bacterium]
MLTEIKVGPPVLTINQGSTFMVTNECGEIDPRQEHGVFAKDTRFLSAYRFTINGQRWDLHSSAQISYYSASMHFTNPPLITAEGELGPRQIWLTLTRTVGDGIHEDFAIVNYSRTPVRLFFELELRSDFADLFDVKRHVLVRRGVLSSEWVPAAGASQLITTYRHQDFERSVIYKVLRHTTPPTFTNGQLVFELRLAPGEQWRTCGYIIPVYDGRQHEPIYPCHQVTAGNTP